MVQLPNIVELVVVYLASARIGAILTPLPVQFRTHELRQAMALTEPKVFITTRRFGDHDYVAMVQGLRPDFPCVEHVIALGDDLPAGVRSLAGILDADVDTSARRRPRRRASGLGQRRVHDLLDLGDGRGAQGGAAQPQPVDRHRLRHRGRGRPAGGRHAAEPLPPGQHVGDRRHAGALAADPRQAGHAPASGPAGVPRPAGRRASDVHGRAARPAQPPAAAAGPPGERRPQPHPQHRLGLGARSRPGW